MLIQILKYYPTIHNLNLFHHVASLMIILPHYNYRLYLLEFHIRATLIFPSLK